MFCNVPQTTSQNYNTAPEITSLSTRGNEQLEIEMKIQQIDMGLR